MKKILLAVAVVAFLASCRRDYTCKCKDSELEYIPEYVRDYENLSNSEADAQQFTCTSVSYGTYICTWSEN